MSEPYDLQLPIWVLGVSEGDEHSLLCPRRCQICVGKQDNTLSRPSETQAGISPTTLHDPETQVRSMLHAASAHKLCM